MFKDVRCNICDNKKEQKQFKYDTHSTCTDIESFSRYIKLKSKLQKRMYSSFQAYTRDC